MAKFWYTEPIHELIQRTGSYPFGLYPAVQYFSSTDKWSSAKPYNREFFTKMLYWAQENCKHPFTFSERYGSLYFADEQDRVMFRLFFGDDDMPEPTHWPGMKDPPPLK